MPFVRTAAPRTVTNNLTEAGEEAEVQVLFTMAEAVAAVASLASHAPTAIPHHPHTILNNEQLPFRLLLHCRLPAVCLSVRGAPCW
jgi:hypothetical protein